ncbi:hypothetical protein [Haloferula sp. A504]|uniref:hypothetical protein n=1 Tax=Haloferula sp. A504 TaxID=3373601 RepID=UPI0031C56496|nr:hypothetical protein [Verrucomicrobiaceae bacterium E54]
MKTLLITLGLVAFTLQGAQAANGNPLRHGQQGFAQSGDYFAKGKGGGGNGNGQRERARKRDGDGECDGNGNGRRERQRKGNGGGNGNGQRRGGS